MNTREPMAVFDRAMDLLRSGPYEEALDEFIWLQRNSLNLDSHFQPVRRTFALAGWALLANRFPPALDAMNELLKSRQRELLASPDDGDLVKDIAALESHIPQMT